MTTTEAGLFWLPDTPDNTVQGKLEITDKGVARVELMGPLTPAMRVHSHDAATGSTMLVPADDPPNLVIHGFVAGGPNRVTLIDCWTPNRTTTHTAAGAIGLQTVQASRLVRGDHIPGDDATFTGLRLRVAGIDAWAGLPGPREECGEDGSVTLRLEPFASESVTTTGGAEIDVERANAHAASAPARDDGQASSLDRADRAWRLELPADRRPVPHCDRRLTQLCSRAIRAVDRVAGTAR